MRHRPLERDCQPRAEYLLAAQQREILAARDHVAALEARVAALCADVALWRDQAGDLLGALNHALEERDHARDTAVNFANAAWHDDYPGRF